MREEGTQEALELSKRLMPKSRTYVPIIVRGEEDKGVRFWALSYTLYKKVLNLIADEEYGDISDINEGTDLTVEHLTPVEAGNKFGKTDFTPKRHTSPLSNDSKLVEKWLNEQPKLEDLFELKSYDELKRILQEWLEGGDVNEEDNQTSTPITNKQTTQTTITTTAKTEENKPSSDVMDKFSAIFNED